MLAQLDVRNWTKLSRRFQNRERFRSTGMGTTALATRCWSARVEALRTGLRELGYVEGKNAVIEFRWADGAAQMRELAAELVLLNVDVIFAMSSTEVEAARHATRTIPIVFATHAECCRTAETDAPAHSPAGRSGFRGSS
jgi:hypothetical protein